MRRSDREVVDREWMDEIIRRSGVCRLAMVDGDRPYVVPLNFGYDGTDLYFHGAVEGKKIDLLRINPRVCVEFDLPGELVHRDTPCSCTQIYQSVLVQGVAEILRDPQAKRHGLEVLMAQYGLPSAPLAADAVRETAILRVRIESITGKEFRG